MKLKICIGFLLMSLLSPYVLSASAEQVDVKDFGALLQGGGFNGVDESIPLKDAIAYAVANNIRKVVVPGPISLSGQIKLGTGVFDTAIGIELDFQMHVVTFLDDDTHFYMLRNSYLHDAQIRVRYNYTKAAVVFHGRERYSSIAPLTLIERIRFLKCGHDSGTAIWYVTQDSDSQDSKPELLQSITSTTVRDVSIEGFQFGIKMGSNPWNGCGSNQESYINSNTLTGVRAHATNYMLSIGDTCAAAGGNVFDSFYYQSSKGVGYCDGPYSAPVVRVGPTATGNLISNIRIYDLGLRQTTDNTLGIYLYPGSYSNHVDGFFANGTNRRTFPTPIKTFPSFFRHQFSRANLLLTNLMHLDTVSAHQ